MQHLWQEWWFGGNQKVFGISDASIIIKTEFVKCYLGKVEENQSSSKWLIKNEIEMCSRVLATDKHFKDPWFYLTSFCYVCDLLKAREASS